MKQKGTLTLWISLYLLVTGAGYVRAGDPWRGQWIWDHPKAHVDPQPEGDRFFRHEFDLNADPNQAHVLVMADNAFVLYVNGEKVAEGEGWWPPVELDPSVHMRAGTNVIAIRATNTGGQAGLFFECDLKTRKGELLHIVSDDRWRVTAEAGPGWSETEFDDSTWPPASTLGRMGTGLWGNHGKPGSRSTTVFEGPLPPQEARQRFTVPEGFEVQLLAAEPDVINPVVMALDDQGRMYVAEAHTYRWGKEKSPVQPPTNPVVMLSPDENGTWRRRAVVAQGFDDPVMGIAIRDGRIWLAALNKVMVGKLRPDGRGLELRTIVRDTFTPWNPFGLFQLSFGPDGWLYQIVGDHPIELIGADGVTLKTRGPTGAFFRFRPDGTGLQMLAQGMRAPFSFDADPYGRWWLISNGEGNPNRMILMIPTVDYHFRTRHGPWEWLSGEHPWSPPVTEMERGANTQVVCYLDNAYPARYWNSLFVANWGAHGLASVNHKIDLYTPNVRGDIESVEVFLDCTDAMFRPTQLLPSPDGHLYMLDWYGKDDENDLTGRIYKIVYTGKDTIRPLPAIASENPEITPRQAKALLDIQSRDRSRRERALEFLAARKSDALAAAIAQILRDDKEPFISAQLLWVLRRMETPVALDAMSEVIQTRHAPLRAMVVRLLRDWNPSDLKRRIDLLREDRDPETRVEVALCEHDPQRREKALLGALAIGTKSDRRLRYQCAVELSRIMNAGRFVALARSQDPDLRQTAWIAMDVACLENENPEAREAMNQLLSSPPPGIEGPLLELCRRWADDSLAGAMQAFARREDLSATQLGQAFAMLSGFGPEAVRGLSEDVLPRFLAGVASGQIALPTPQEMIGALELVERHTAGEDGGALLRRCLAAGDVNVRIRALEAIEACGWRYPDLFETAWETAFKRDRPLSERIQAIAALSQQDQAPAKRWARLLDEPDPHVVRMALRTIRWFVADASIRAIALEKASTIHERYPDGDQELGVLLRAFDAPAELLDKLKLPGELSPDRYPEIKSTMLQRLPQASVVLGKEAFRQLGCASCHEVAGDRLTYGPSLKGIGDAATADYIAESILLPNRVIKDGFDVERVTLEDGQTLEGYVEARQEIIVIRRGVEDTVDVPLRDVVDRRKIDRSPMPELLIESVSIGELADLLAYLVAQGGDPGAASPNTPTDTGG